MKTSARMASFQPYFFAGVSERINRLRSAGADVIRLDAGNPDMPPAPFILETLKRSADNPNHHGYQSFGGPPAFRQAVSDYYGKRFGVELDPEGEVLGLIGSKEGVFNTALVFLDPGDVALVPDPGYPAYSTGPQFVGADVYYMPLLEQNEFLPDLGAIPAGVLNRARLMWLNYPNNPTGAVAPLEFFAEAVALARRHDLLLCHDAPYVDISFEGYRSPSLLQVPGAKDVVVEFNSLSKTYNMAGWRVGLAVGNAEALRALGTLKSNIDSASFQPIYDAACAALTGDQTWIRERNAIYRERRDIVMDGLRAAGLTARRPQAAMYVWVRVPAGATSAGFSADLLEATGVSITPGPTFGPGGEGYVRLALGVPTPRIREAMVRLVEWVHRKT